MKKIALLALIAIAIPASDAASQSSGTVNVVGRVAKSAAIRWSDFTPLGGETGTNVPAVPNAPLLFEINVDDIAAGNNLADYAGGTVQMVLRSNTNYVLSAQVTTTNNFGQVGDGDLALSDVGFGITAMTNSGPKVFGDPAAASLVSAGFESDPSQALKDADEEPSFDATLEDLTPSQQVLSGPRISQRGGVGSPNNGLLVDATFALGPQFYTPVDPFSATVTFTLATP